MTSFSTAGRSYHVKFAPPKSYKGGAASVANMIDDETGEALMQRPDDTSAVPLPPPVAGFPGGVLSGVCQALVKRLSEYHSMTTPILEHYAPKGIVTKIDGNMDKKGVWAQIEKVSHCAVHMSVCSLYSVYMPTGSPCKPCLSSCRTRTDTNRHEPNRIAGALMMRVATARASRGCGAAAGSQVCPWRTLRAANSPAGKQTPPLAGANQALGIATCCHAT